MIKKWFVVIFVLCLGLGSSAFGVNTFFVGGASDTLWSTAGNWDNGVPTINDNAVLDAGKTTLIDSSVAAEGQEVFLAWTYNDATLNMTGGTLTTKWNLYHQVYNNHTGIFNLSGGVVTVPYHYWMGAGSPGTPAGTGILNMTGGELDIGGYLIQNWVGGVGNEIVHLDGGVINAALWHIEGPAYMDITRGIFNIAGDATVDVKAALDAGQLTGYGQKSLIEYNYDGTVTKVWAIPEPASMLLLGLGGLTFLKRRK